MEVIVDRIEEDYLVLELSNQKSVNIPKSLLPDACEGDIIDININYEKRAKREKEIQELQKNLFLDFDEKEE